MDRCKFPIETAIVCSIAKIRVENTLPCFGWHTDFWITKRSGLDYERADSHLRTFRVFIKVLSCVLTEPGWKPQ